MPNIILMVDFFSSLFDKMVHFKEQSTLWEDSFKSSDELCRTKDVQILYLVHRVTSLEKKIVEIEKKKLARRINLLRINVLNLP